MWGEIIAGEEGERKRKRTKRLEKVRKQKEEAASFSWRRKGNVVAGGRKRNPNGSGKFWCAND